MKKTVMCMGLVFLITAVSVGMLSCAGGGSGSVTYVLTFVDRYSGDPVPGVVVYLNGEAKTAGLDGKVSVSAEGPLRLEGYVNPVALFDLGYEFFDSSLYFYFAFTASGSVSRTLILEPLSGPPEGYEISGTVSGIQWGNITVYSSDGRMVGDDSIGIFEYEYSTTVYDTGFLYFIVYNDVTGEWSYMTAEVTGAGEYDLAYDGADITLAGDVSDTADSVGAWLVLGEELVWLNSVDLESPFSIVVPHRGTDEIMLVSSGGDEEGPVWRHSGGFTASASGIDLSFASGSTVPAEWDSGLNMTGPRTFSWNAAGNANAYRMDILGVGGGRETLIAFIEGTSLTIDESIDLSSIVGASITPIRTEGFIGNIGQPQIHFVPASLLGGTTKYYMAVQDEWWSGPT